jgi:hypothetical protein
MKCVPDQENTSLSNFDCDYFECSRSDSVCLLRSGFGRHCHFQWNAALSLLTQRKPKLATWKDYMEKN